LILKAKTGFERILFARYDVTRSVSIPFGKTFFERILFAGYDVGQA
jgi:hypothetical protein